MPLINFAALARAPLAREPFTFTVAPDLISPDAAAAIRADFPVIADSGLLPVEATRPGPKFLEFLKEVDGPDSLAAWVKNSASISCTALR